MKISVITPSYNDAKSIVETLDSIKEQTYKNWESIIIDDGSTDNTKDVIRKYVEENKLEEKIKYIYQENSDQLNAIINGLQYITGDYVYILHSDDLLPNKEFFEESMEFIKANPDCEATIGDLTIINENSEITNRWKALKYNSNKNTPANLILNYGANIYGDVGFRTKENFMNTVFNNYLTWNMPFWIDMDNNARTTNVKNYPKPILKYRIHSENYANNEIGKFCALNGELRTLTRLMAEYKIKFYSAQRFLFMITRMRGIRRLGLAGYFSPICNREETSDKQKATLITKAIKNTYGDEYKSNIFLTSLEAFYKSLDNNRKVELHIDDETPIYKGKDIRIFAKKLFNNELPKLYEDFMNEMKQGFREIVVDEKYYDKAIDIAKFMCIYPYVKINKIIE